MRTCIPNILAFLVFFSFSALAWERVKVVDGDSLFIDKTEIRLSGIDAPEFHQTCKDAGKKEYPCGLQSYEYLKKLAGQDTACEKIVTDKYKREVSVCFSNGTNLNQKMVEAGWAVAYTRYTNEYDAAEKQAKANKAGIWQGRFMKPEFFRILQRENKKERKNLNFD